ncbi:hypothetical protein ACIGW9_34860, partial [Streptomyces sp. NPDC053813]
SPKSSARDQHEHPEPRAHQTRDLQLHDAQCSLGAAWGITRQGARKKWPDALDRSTPAEAEPSRIELCGGSAELFPDPSSGG